MTLSRKQNKPLHPPLNMAQLNINEVTSHKHLDVASDVGVNLCNVKSCLNTSNNEIFTDKRGDLPCVNISKHTCPVVK